MRYLEIDLLAFQDHLLISELENTKYIWDPIRKKKLVLQPEEMVRQLLVLAILKYMKPPLSRVSIEKSITVHGQKKRYDIVIFDWDFKPFLIVECKSFHINLDEEVFRQIGVYNLTAEAPYRCVSNGKSSILFHIQGDSIIFEANFPSYPKRPSDVHSKNPTK